MPRHVLRRAEEKIAILIEGIVRQRDDPVLQVTVEIDEKVAAGYQVHLGERRIPQQVVHREQAYFPKLVGNPVGSVLPHEEPVQALRGYIVRDGRRIASAARSLYGLQVDVAREDLESWAALRFGCSLAQQH